MYIHTLYYFGCLALRGYRWAKELLYSRHLLYTLINVYIRLWPKLFVHPCLSCTTPTLWIQITMQSLRYKKNDETLMQTVTEQGINTIFS